MQVFIEDSALLRDRVTGTELQLLQNIPLLNQPTYGVGLADMNRGNLTPSARAQWLANGEKRS